MTTDDPAQLLSFLWLCYAAVFLRLGGETAARRRTRKISVPVGYKFRPTDEDLVNHHLKRKLINVPDDYCLIPEYNHYEAEPWHLITKYNELSDGESDDNECFFFSTNRSGKQTGRSTPKGYWHETSKKKPIEGGDGVTYVMRYFTFYIGRRQKDGNITLWRMREFTDPSNKGFALCKIFKDVDDQKKKNDVHVSSSTVISTGYQNRVDSSQEVSLDMFVETSRIRTPLSDANLISGMLVSPTQLRSPSSDLNLMNDSAISPHQQQTHNEEGSLLALNAFADQFLDLDNSRQHDQLTYSKNTLNDGYSYEHANMLYPCSVTSNVGVVPASKRRHRAEGTSLEASQQPSMKKSRIPINYSQDLDLQPSKYYPQRTYIDLEKISFFMNSSFNSSISFDHKDNMLIGNGSEEVNSEEVSLANYPTQPMNLPSSDYEVFSQYQLQLPVEGSCKDGYVEVPQPWSMSLVSDNHNILSLSESRHTQQINMELKPRDVPFKMELLVEHEAASPPSNYISLDDISASPLPSRRQMEISSTKNSTNTEGHRDELTFSLSPSNPAYDKVKSYGVENHKHEAQQTIQQVLFSPPQSPTQFCFTPQNKDMQFISKDMSLPDIDDDYQRLWG